MKKLILCLLFFINFTSLAIFGQVTSVVTLDNTMAVWVGSLPKSSVAVYQKLKIEVFGGNWHVFNLAQTTFYISTRDGLVINKEIHGGGTDHYEIRVYDVGDSYDFVIKVREITSIIISSWLTGGVGLNESALQKLQTYDVNAKTDVTDLFTMNTLIATSEVGNIGIGIDNPEEKLDVNGSGVIKSNQYLGKWEEGKSGWGSQLHFRGADYNLYDDIYLARFNVASGKTDLRLSLADDRSGDDRFIIGNTSGENPWKNFLTVYNNGRVGINLQTDPQSELEVNGEIKSVKSSIDSIKTKDLKVDGIIKTREILVTNTGWADFVFRKDYKLPTLQSVKQHIETYNTLPGIPSQKEVQDKGVNVSEMMVKLLQKVEEQTLYIIQLQEEINKLKKEL